jgi:hypothetical protein
MLPVRVLKLILVIIRFSKGWAEETSESGKRGCCRRETSFRLTGGELMIGGSDSELPTCLRASGLGSWVRVACCGSRDDETTGELYTLANPLTGALAAAPTC